MVYGVLAEVRQRIGNMGTANVPDAMITIAIASGDALVNNLTGKTPSQPWDSVLDPVIFPIAREASNFFASSIVRENFADKEGVSNDHRRIAENMCKMINESSSSLVPSPTTVIKSQPYKTAPLNPNGEIKLSIHGRRQISDEGVTVF